jgi:hypothetical protein
MIDEEFEFSRCGLHCNLARVLRIRFVCGEPHGEFKRRDSPFKTGREVMYSAAEGEIYS